MRVLVLVPQAPFSPKSGAALRCAAIIKHLSKEHQVHLIALAESSHRETVSLSGCLPIEMETVPSPNRSRAKRLADTLTKNLPDMALRLYSADYVRAVQRAVDQNLFDIIQIQGLETAFALPRLNLSGQGPPVVYDAFNAEYNLQKLAFQVDSRTPSRWLAAMYSWVQWRRLAAYEGALCRGVDAITVASAEDKEAVLALAPEAKITVVPSGVDTEVYRPAGGPGNSEVSDGRGDILFTGTMDYRPNVDAVRWFCQEIMPLVLRQVPEAHLWIVGRRPAGAVRKLAGPSVTVTGEVEDDIPFFHRAQVYVLPMRYGGGVRLKLLQAMSCGLPVVSTSAGAEGVAVTDGADILLADRPEEFAAAVVRALLDREHAVRLGRRARKTVEERYAWEKTLAGLAGVYAGLKTANLA